MYLNMKKLFTAYHDDVMIVFYIYTLHVNGHKNRFLVVYIFGLCYLGRTITER